MNGGAAVGCCCADAVYISFVRRSKCALYGKKKRCDIYKQIKYDHSINRQFFSHTPDPNKYIEIVAVRGTVVCMIPHINVHTNL